MGNAESARRATAPCGVSATGNADAAVVLAALIQELAEARRRLDVTLTSLSQELGITPMAVAHWEHGRDAPSAGNFILWAEALGFKATVLDRAGMRYATRAVPRRGENAEQFRIRSIALLLRDIRREAELTQEALGERLQVSAWTIQMWEGARRVPRVTRLIQWCSVLGCRLALTPV